VNHNPVLANEQGIIEERQGDVISAGAYPNPSFNFQVGDGQVRDPSNGLSVTERVFSFNQPVEWPSKRKARKLAAKAGVESAQAGLGEVKLNLIAKAKILFYELMLAEEITTLTGESLTTIQHVAKVVTQRVDAGDTSPFQQVKVNVEVLQARQALAKARGTVNTARTALNTVAAGALGTHYVLRGEFLMSNHDDNIDETIEQALANHPTITKLRKRLEQANHHLVQEKQTRIPNVTFNSFYARDAGRESIGGGILIPIPLWYQQGGEIAGALAKKRQVEAKLLLSHNELEKSIAQNLQRLESAAAERKVYEEGFLKQAKEAVRIAQVSFQHGEASLLELLDAQRVLWQTLHGFAQAQFDLSAAFVHLEHSLGTL
ncbi:MAG TPA: TolC family protein, partial [Nitrospirales bacterium]|nr:TolC family protein [Nitrospirales bacterium]